VALAVIAALVAGLNGMLAQWIAYLLARNAQRAIVATGSSDSRR
jgi:hypothetical protein